MKRPMFLVPAVVVAALVVAAMAGGVWLLRYDAIKFGSEYGSGQRLFLGSVPAPSGVDGKVLYYRWVPGGRFEAKVSIRNPGSLPITILGAGDSAVRNDPGGFLGFWLQDLALSREGAPEGEIYTDPTTAAPMSPYELAPDQELAVWARYRIGASCDGQVPWIPEPDVPLGSASGMSTDQLPVRFSVLGLPRQVEIEMPFVIFMTNSGPDAITVCPTDRTSPG